MGNMWGIRLASMALVPATMLTIASAAHAEGQGPTCKVTIDRSQAEGVYDVTRQVYGDGSCVCYAYTQPVKPASDPVEKMISALLERKTCPAARLLSVPGSGGAGAAAATGGGAAAAFAAITAATIGAASSTNDDGDPVSP